MSLAASVGHMSYGQRKLPVRRRRPAFQRPCRLALQVTKTFSEHISQYAQVVVESLAFAGTGDVLRVQQFLSVAGDHIEVEEATLWKVRSLDTMHTADAFLCQHTMDVTVATANVSLTRTSDQESVAAASMTARIRCALCTKVELQNSHSCHEQS